MNKVRAALELVDEFMHALAADDWPQGLTPGLRSLWAMVHTEVRAALDMLPDGAQCADRPRPAAELLVGRLVNVDLPAGAEVQPALVVDADATCLMLQMRGGDLIAVPWSGVHCIRSYTRACRVCGCTDERACSDGCCWVEVDLCSACEEGREFEAEAG